MEEIWKDIKGYEGLYQVSNLGRVKSLDRLRKNNSKLVTLPQKYVNGTIAHNGYRRIVLSKEGKPKSYPLHILVLEAFKPNSNKELYYEVNHKDGDKLNNRLDNLEWSNRSHNLRHAYSAGLIKPRRGVDNNKCKITFEEAVAVKVLWNKGYPNSKISEILNISETVCKNINAKNSWNWNYEIVYK